jgi:hypothetical protein
MKRLAFLIILLCLATIRPGAAAPPGANDDTAGPYRLIFRGCYSGSGSGTVTSKSVVIRGKLVDEDGNKINFVSPNLKLNNYRFYGTANVQGLKVSIAGRVDPSGGALRKARIVCTFSVLGIQHGRIAGDHQ